MTWVRGRGKIVPYFYVFRLAAQRQPAGPGEAQGLRHREHLQGKQLWPVPEKITDRLLTSIEFHVQNDNQEIKLNCIVNKGKRK